MSKENLFEVVHQHPILTPHSSRSIIAVSENVVSSYVLGREVPQNNIVEAQLLQTTENNLHLIGVRRVLTAQDSPLYNRRQVVGFEDPTLLPENVNPFRQEDGYLATQVIKKDHNKRGVSTNLVYVARGNTNPKVIMSPSDVVAHGMAPFADMVKEGEVLPKDFLLYEWAGGPNSSKSSSNIGIGLIEGEAVVALRKFYTIDDDNSEHVSTAGAPVILPDGRIILFYNRRVQSEWVVSFMMKDTTSSVYSTKNWKIYNEPLLRAPRTVGRGPGNQLIAFASSSTLVGDNPPLIRVLYHVNDNTPYEALLEWKDTR